MFYLSLFPPISNFLQFVYQFQSFYPLSILFSLYPFYCQFYAWTLSSTNLINYTCVLYSALSPLNFAPTLYFSHHFFSSSLFLQFFLSISYFSSFFPSRFILFNRFHQFPNFWPVSCPSFTSLHLFPPLLSFLPSFRQSFYFFPIDYILFTSRLNVFSLLQRKRKHSFASKTEQNWGEETNKTRQISLFHWHGHRQGKTKNWSSQTLYFLRNVQAVQFVQFV